jgi:PEP-CTERM motif
MKTPFRANSGIFRSNGLSRMKTKLICAVGLASAIGLPPSDATAFIVDVNSMNDIGTTIDLASGTYIVTFIGIGNGGAYDAWNPFTSVSGCDVNGANCTEGYTNAFLITAPSLPGGGSYYSAVTNSYSSAIGSLSAYQSAEATNELVTALASSDLMDPASYSQLTGPIQFTLATPTPIKFSVYDSFFGDNLGGVSLDVSISSVPEPSTWAMLMLGLSGLAILGYHARKAPPRTA